MDPVGRWDLLAHGEIRRLRCIITMLRPISEERISVRDAKHDE